MSEFLQKLTHTEWVEIVCTAAIILILGLLDFGVVVWQHTREEKKAKEEEKLWEEDRKRQEEQQTALDSIVEELVEMNDGGVKLVKEQQNEQNP